MADLFGEEHEQEEYGLFGNEHRRQEAAKKLKQEQENCEHDEVMKQGDGFVYGHCSKCLKELY